MGFMRMVPNCLDKDKHGQVYAGAVNLRIAQPYASDPGAMKSSSLQPLLEDGLGTKEEVVGKSNCSI